MSMTKHALTKSADEPIRWVVKPRRKRATKEPKTKRDQLTTMLNAKNGAEADAICRKLGWLPHTTRAAISRLRKAGMDIQSEMPTRNKPTRYRLIAKGMAEEADNAA
jgi:predicted ArsR family transcriptional regulator